MKWKVENKFFIKIDRMISWEDIVVILMFVGIGILIYMNIWMILLKVPFIRTNRKIVRKMVAAAEIKEGDVVCDLGCGDGTILFEAEKAGGKCIGFERIQILVWWGRMRNFFRKQSVMFLCEDFYKADLSKTDILFCYLSGPMTEKLYQLKYKELKSGAKIVSNMFQISSIPPTKIIKNKSRKIFLYVKK